MICSMCNSEINPDFEPYKVSTPDGMQRNVCGRCFMLTKINDTLLEILKELKDGRLRIT